MPEPVPSGGQVPTTQQPAAPQVGGDSPIPGAVPASTSQADDGDATSTLTHEQALREVARLRRLEAEHRTARRDLETWKAERERADMTKEEQLAASLADKERALSERDQTLQERTLRYEVQLHAARLGFIDADDAAKLLDRSQVEYADDGTPKNLGTLLKALAAAKPHLVASTVQQAPMPSVSATNPPSGNQGRVTFTPSQIASMSPAEYQQHRAAIFQAQREGRILPG